MSAKSRQRERENERGWSKSERHAYRERKRQKRFTGEFRARPQAAVRGVEAPMDNEIELE